MIAVDLGIPRNRHLSDEHVTLGQRGRFAGVHGGVFRQVAGAAAEFIGTPDLVEKVGDGRVLGRRLEIVQRYRAREQGSNIRSIRR
ncbi:hypothetical protein [Bifidobacterium callitrichos]|uniref:hypothetical protein n=1 Tax=Bifidobacterium callitrichos TaxID=762209 RepID=UPI0012E09C17|nr:hypothetical protein [Bifidobacterium callitrichos]